MKDYNYNELLAHVKEEYNLTAADISLLEGQKNIVYIPTNRITARFEAILKRDKKGLQTVHPDTDVATELCYIFLDNFKSTHKNAENANDIYKAHGYKILYSVYLGEQLGKRVYPKIINLLLKHRIIVRGRDYITGKPEINLAPRSNEYKLQDKYYGIGVEPYTLSTKIAKRLRNKMHNNNMEKLFTSEIGMNSFSMSKYITFPDESEVLEMLTKHAKEGTYTNKRNKLLKILPENHSTNEDAYSRDKYIFVHDYMNIFIYLRDCFKYPIIKDEKSGMRVYDSFNMMPRIIRKMIKLNGQSLVECDFSCLHPNIAQKVFGGSNEEPITHDMVTQTLFKISPDDDNYTQKRQEVKIEHLSFFNKTWGQMQQSPLFNYYNKKEPNMMNRIGQYKDEEGHKSTSKELFTMETELMTNVIRRTRKEGIDVLYCFDALYCESMDRDDVVEIMNEEAAKMKINTKAAI
tara:strand:+ start:832 stop:2217 length:1386 start_codon:yes stop_codon:yes gene_type:complete